jgi:hypothetical protein
MQMGGDSSSSCQVGELYDMATVLGFAASLQAQLKACHSKKVQLEAELAAEKASTAALQFQTDRFAELATHFALVSYNTLRIPTNLCSCLNLCHLEDITTAKEGAAVFLFQFQQGLLARLLKVQLRFKI